MQVVDCSPITSIVGTTCNKAVDRVHQACSTEARCWFVATCEQAGSGWEQAVRKNLATSLFQQACYKSAAGLLQVVRFLRVSFCAMYPVSLICAWIHIVVF